MRSAVEVLGATRIGHGIRSVDDPDVLRLLAERQVMCEVSMTSNVALGVVTSVEEHPVARLVAAEVPVSINTDDPAYFRTDLTTELELARDVHGVDVVDAQRAALEHSFAPQDVKAAIGAELGPE